MIGREPHVVKHLHVDDDWLMRSTGDLRCRPLLMWRCGLLDPLPACIDHAIVGAAAGEGRNGWGAALLMRAGCACRVDRCGGQDRDSPSFCACPSVPNP